MNRSAARRDIDKAVNDLSIQIKTCSARETIEAGKRIGAKLVGGDIVAFRGGLGAGKTTITRGIAMGVGLKDDVSSPTFALVNEYVNPMGPNIYHFDMYRISSDELEAIGFFDYLGDESIILIEWSENIEDMLPKVTIVIEIERISDEERLIAVSGGERFADIGD